MSSIVAIIYLVLVEEVQDKWLSILELPDKGLTIPSLVLPPSIRSVQLFECHPGGHNLHEILWFLEGNFFECLTLRNLFSYGLQHIHISKIFISEVLVNGISRYTLGPVFTILDRRSSVDTKLQQGCDTLWKKNTPSRTTHLPVENICSHIRSIRQIFLPSSYHLFGPS